MTQSANIVFTTGHDAKVLTPDGVDIVKEIAIREVNISILPNELPKAELTVDVLSDGIEANTTYSVHLGKKFVAITGFIDENGDEILIDDLL